MAGTGRNVRGPGGKVPDRQRGDGGKEPGAVGGGERQPGMTALPSAVIGVLAPERMTIRAGPPDWGIPAVARASQACAHPAVAGDCGSAGLPSVPQRRSVTVE